MTKVTYWFGAGASALALPTINNFHSKVSQSRDELIGISNRISDIDINYEIGRIIEECYEPLLAYLVESASFGTIDTLAKFYMTANPGVFNRIKKLLQLFFITEDYVLSRMDNRYLGLLTNISNGLTLDDKINFISWNYDTQLLKAKRVLSGAGVVIPKWDTEDLLAEGSGSIVYHLNGESSDNTVAQFPVDHLGSLGVNDSKVLDYICKSLNDKKYVTGIRYAFEDNNTITDRIFKDMDSRLLETNILVIIGYSFPFANRKVDTNILGKLKNLRKVYVQDVNPDHVIEKVAQILNNYKHNFNQYNGKSLVTITPITDISSFYIPYEL